MSRIESTVQTFCSDICSARVATYIYENLPVCFTYFQYFRLINYRHLAEIFDVTNPFHSLAHTSLCGDHFKQLFEYLYV
jgi:hypothetical protein